MKTKRISFFLFAFISYFAFAEESPANDKAIIGAESYISDLANQLVSEQGIDAEINGSQDIPGDILLGRYKIGITSKKWTDLEVAKFYNLKGYRPTQLYLTADVVAILINQDNPNTSMTVGQIGKVFGCNEDITPAKWPREIKSASEQYILPFAVSEDFNIHQRFSDWVECSKGTYSLTQFVADEDDLLDKLDSEAASMVYVTYNDKWEDSKILSIIDRYGDLQEANIETIYSGRYPLSSVYYMYVDLPPYRNELNQSEQRVLELTTTSNHTETLNQYGFLRLPEEAIHRNKIALKIDEPLISGGYK